MEFKTHRDNLAPFFVHYKFIYVSHFIYSLPIYRKLAQMCSCSILYKICTVVLLLYTILEVYTKYGMVTGLPEKLTADGSHLPHLRTLSGGKRSEDIQKGLLQNSSLKKYAQNPEPFQSQNGSKGVPGFCFCTISLCKLLSHFYFATAPSVLIAILPDFTAVIRDIRR